MELRHLRYFVAVADSLSLSKAADVVHVTQPAISRQIKDLEDELGVLLFVRNSNGVTLTESGVLFRLHCSKILAQTEEAIRAVCARSNSQTDSLRIGFDSLSGNSYLTKALNALGTLSKHTNITIDEHRENTILQRLLTADLDVGIITGDRRNNLSAEFDSVVIAKRSASVLLAKGHRLATNTPLHFQDLQTFKLVVVGDAGRSYGEHFVVDICRQANIAPSSVIHAPNRMTMYSLIAAHRGFGIVLDEPDLELFSGALDRFTIPQSDSLVHTYAVWLRKSHVPARELFLQILHDMNDLIQLPQVHKDVPENSSLSR